MAEGLNVTCSFSSGLLLFGLRVGSNWNLSDGQERKKNTVCMCKVSFHQPQDGKRKNEQVLFSSIKPMPW